MQALQDPFQMYAGLKDLRSSLEQEKEDIALPYACLIMHRSALDDNPYRVGTSARVGTSEVEAPYCPIRLKLQIFVYKQQDPERRVLCRANNLPPHLGTSLASHGSHKHGSHKHGSHKGTPRAPQATPNVEFRQSSNPGAGDHWRQRNDLDHYASDGNHSILRQMLDRAFAVVG